MKQVCVLGNGQLGRMLRQAGEPLGIAVWPVGLDAEPEAVPFHQSVITAEIERWPETALTRELARHNAFVNRDVFPIIADRLTQKQLFDKLGLPTAPWQLLSDKSEWNDVFAMLGELAIVKRRVGGYDGRGQWRLRENEIDQLPADNYGECIVEQGRRLPPYRPVPWLRAWAEGRWPMPSCTVSRISVSCAVLHRLPSWCIGPKAWAMRRWR